MLRLGIELDCQSGSFGYLDVAGSLLPWTISLVQKTRILSILHLKLFSSPNRLLEEIDSLSPAEYRVSSDMCLLPLTTELNCLGLTSS
jgi:hypothetical protein